APYAIGQCLEFRRVLFRSRELFLLLALLLGAGALPRFLLRARDRRGVGRLPAGGGLLLERLARVLRSLGFRIRLLALQLRDARLELAHARLGRGLLRARRRRRRRATPRDRVHTPTS